MYLAPNIDQVLESNKYRFLGKNEYSSIARRLNIAFGHPKDLRFKFEEFDELHANDYTFAGLYDMTTDKRYVILNVSSNAKTLHINRNDYRTFKFLISQAIQHETIHQLQWQYRDEIDDPVKLDFRNLHGTLSEEREYLSDKDEIDAYAHDIAMEIKFYYPNKNPYDQLNNIDRLRKLPSYNYYKITFKNCRWNRIKKQLLLKTYKWIPHV